MVATVTNHAARLVYMDPGERTNLAVTAYVKHLFSKWNKEGESHEAIGKRVGITKAHVSNVKNGHAPVGRALEAGVARVMTDGSVDRLRQDALKYAADHGIDIDTQAMPEEVRKGLEAARLTLGGNKHYEAVVADIRTRLAGSSASALDTLEIIRSRIREQESGVRPSESTRIEDGKAVSKHLAPQKSHGNGKNRAKKVTSK